MGTLQSSAAVKLPRSVTPAWPNVCIACGCAHPKGRVRLPVSVALLGSRDPARMREYLKPRQLRVPVCGDCAATVRRARRTRMLAYGVVAAIVTVAALTTSLWVAAILGAMIAAAWAAVEWLTKPWPVAAKAHDDTIAYAFTRREMARQFAFVNRVALD